MCIFFWEKICPVFAARHDFPYMEMSLSRNLRHVITLSCSALQIHCKPKHHKDITKEGQELKVNK